MEGIITEITLSDWVHLSGCSSVSDYVVTVKHDRVDRFRTQRARSYWCHSPNMGLYVTFWGQILFILKLNLLVVTSIWRKWKKYSSAVWLEFPARKLFSEIFILFHSILTADRNLHCAISVLCCQTSKFYQGCEECYVKRKHLPPAWTKIAFKARRVPGLFHELLWTYHTYQIQGKAVWFLVARHVIYKRIFNCISSEWWHTMLDFRTRISFCIVLFTRISSRTIFTY